MSLDRWLRALLMRLRSLVGYDAADRDLDDELRFHLEQAVAEGEAKGLSPDAAWRAARLALGGVEQRKEECREARGLHVVRTFGRDLRFAARLIRRRPGFSVVAIATLALGIGANTAVFAIVNGVLLQPLPFPESDRLLMLSSSPAGVAWRGLPAGLFEDAYLEVDRSTSLFEDVALFATTPAVVTGAGEPARVRLATVTPELFDVLRVSPALGRGLSRAADNAQDVPAVIISDAFWRSQFGADPDIVGRLLKLEGETHRVAGVMPPGFAFPDETDCWTTIEVRPYQGGNSFIRPVIGRLKAGVSREQAHAELDALTRPDGSTPAEWEVMALPLKDRVVGDVRRPLLVLIAAVAFVLLVACVNLANLFLIRMSERTRELTVRAALGAGRRRLVQQLFAESLVVAVLGAAAGLVLAGIGLPALLALAPAGAIPRVDLVRIDEDVVLVTAVLSLLTTAAFGLLPAFRATRRRGWSEPVSRTVTDRREGLHGALVVAEIALSLILLTGAGLMLQGFLSLRAVDTGFNANGVLTATIDLPAASYGAPAQAQRFYTDALANLDRVPGIESVGTINWLPFGDRTINGDFVLDGGRLPSPRFNVDKPAASAGYFRAMGIPLLRGREFTADDGAASMPVAVVSDSAARSLWPGEEPIGQRISLRNPPRSERDWLTVVGVVGDVRQQSLTAEGNGAIYQSYLQVDRLPFLDTVTFVMRTASDPAALAPDVRAALRQPDPDLPVPALVAMPTRLAAHTASPAFQARVLSLFGAVALGLTIVGIYGVLAYSVSRRAREFGIRMALGAGAGNLVRMVVSRTLVLAAVGVAIGAAGALVATRWLDQYLVGIAPTNPATLVIVALLMIGAALAAAALPAWRAARMDPTIVLRAE
jgi:predicted permease